MKRRKFTLIEGLSAGVERADVRGMAAGIGDGLVRVSEGWLPKQKLAVPQYCPMVNCMAGTYASLTALRAHLSSAHAGMSDRERSFVLDQTRRTAVRQAMNGNPRAP